MIRDNIFAEEIELPEIVQKKADSAFLTIRTKGKDRTEQMAKRKRKTDAGTLAAAAACAAVVIAAGTLAGPLRGLTGHSAAGGKNPAGTGAEDMLAAAADRIDKMFTLQVQAKEAGTGESVALAQGKPVPVTIHTDGGNSWVLCADDDANGTVNYCIGLPQITCEGEQIERVTYSINHGAFQIVQPEQGESIIVDGQPYAGELNTGSIGGDYSEERDGEPSEPFETLLYQSFTLDYDRQADDKTWLNFCNVRSGSEDVIQSIWGEDTDIERYNSGIQKMLDHTVITCTVEYADHTTRSADIEVDSRIMTRREAGEQPDPEMDPQELDEETVVITFELQE